jgi:hypothetical protein
MWFDPDKADVYEGRRGEALYHTAADQPAHKRKWVVRRQREGAPPYAKLTPERARAWLLANGHLAAVAELFDARLTRGDHSYERVNLHLPDRLVAAASEIAGERGTSKAHELRRLVALGAHAHRAGFGGGPR